MPYPTPRAAVSMRLAHALLIMLGLVLSAAIGLATHTTHATPTTTPTQAAPTIAPTYIPHHATTRPESTCRAAAHHLYLTQDYAGTDTELACFGEENDPRVGLALDYGMTEDQYAAAERADAEGAYAAPSVVPAPSGFAAPGLVLCTQEDGSDPGQAFPCRWDASAQGNGTGESFTLWSAGSDPDYS